jgi:pyruvate/2-oxoglutarate dehydrogenase complex dihydrolipoamide dehydrogenase (E3) component
VRKGGEKLNAKYDLVVIGGGNAGYTPAIRASQLRRPTRKEH